MIAPDAQHFLQAVALVAGLASQPLSAQEVELFSIGSGDVSGNYFPVAKALCDAFNAADDTRRRCSPEPTPGSIYNLELLGQGELEFAIAQSDWVNAAFGGRSPFSDKATVQNVRMVMPLFPEPVTVLTTQGSGIETALDLLGRVVDIGRPASGRNATIRYLLERLEFDASDFGEVLELEPANAIEELCAGRIDAAIFVVGHPSDLIQNATRTCNARIIDFVGPNINRIASEETDYLLTEIDLTPYGRPGQTAQTIAVTATLVVQERVENSIVADLVAAVENDASGSIAANPLLKNLQSAHESAQGSNVPLHAGVAADKQ